MKFTLEKCGMMAVFNNEKKIHQCKCVKMKQILIGKNTICKLLFQELITMNIAPRIITDKQ